MYQQGDIVLVAFPFTDLSGSKIRPAIVLASHKKSVDIVVAFITSQYKRSAHFVVPIVPTTQNGLKVASSIICDKIATLDKKVVVGKIGVGHKSVIRGVTNELVKLFAVK